MIRLLSKSMGKKGMNYIHLLRSQCSHGTLSRISCWVNVHVLVFYRYGSIDVPTNMFLQWPTSLPRESDSLGAAAEALFNVEKFITASKILEFSIDLL